MDLHAHADLVALHATTFKPARGGEWEYITWHRLKVEYPDLTQYQTIRFYANPPMR